MRTCTLINLLFHAGLINCAPDLTAEKDWTPWRVAVQFISLFSSKGSQHSEVYQLSSICIDSTNTVHVTDYNDCVHVQQFRFMNSSFGRLPKDVAVDNTTGVLHLSWWPCCWVSFFNLVIFSQGLNIFFTKRTLKLQDCVIITTYVMYIRTCMWLTTTLRGKLPPSCC